ncbi:RNA polymerase sigma factor [Sphingobacterium lactis]|uniref:RNA polymerase sigma-70 factor, ECF subfamily n=1 Tax=Sphingobacterium lactis TaxID=797291 RepID=A0A1H5UEZ5_9SPHI|nr:sigma-70 family RNA polymerase sigma factor [Sphingobacterium lactis]SEF73038.1 RNA polymerase sigma-70 factor, ECF subfamily [Sphingobacterium lactis]
MSKFNFNRDVMQQSNVLLEYAKNFTKDHNDAEDLLQDTLIKVYRYIDNFKEGTNLTGWIYTIMRNTFINNYRKKSIVNSVVTQKEEFTPSDLIKSSVKNNVENAFLNDDIQYALQKLPEMYYRPFVMHFEGYKYYEIAEYLQIPDGTVKTRIHMARKMLQGILKEYKVSRSA